MYNAFKSKYVYPGLLAFCLLLLAGHTCDAFSQSPFMLNTMLKAYRAYFAAIDAGAEMRRLPYEIKQKLTPYYSGRLLEGIRYGESRTLVIADNAMTDCHNIYFPSDSGMIRIVENGLLFDKKHRDELHWLLHELAHSQQCETQGGRDAYAKIWFGDLTATTLTQLITDPRNVNDRVLHDAMPMEKAAEQKAVEILKKIPVNQ
jgi:hypothetical protein